MTTEELETNEREYFLKWRRSLASLQEEGIQLTPFEKNLEFWRQLWRVIERSDVIVQIVDARNPLLFRCSDLEAYVKEVSQNKLNMLLINKADFLSELQRESWANYFESIGVRVVFYSATLNCDGKIIRETSEGNGSLIDTTINEIDESVIEEEETELQSDVNENEGNFKPNLNAVTVGDVKNEIMGLERSLNATEEQLSSLLKHLNELLHTDLEILSGEDSKFINKDTIKNSSKLLTRDELIQIFREVHRGPKLTNGVTTIGLVGYPNVGKSSTINSFMSTKKVSVSATPGKTKHFQTLYLDKDLMLCDSPGLVMPSFIFTKAEMVVNGILPPDQLRDHVPPINYICTLIPRHVLESKYSIMLPKPMEGEDENRNPFAEELLNAYGCKFF